MEAVLPYFYISFHDRPTQIFGAERITSIKTLEKIAE